MDHSQHTKIKWLLCSFDVSFAASLSHEVLLTPSSMADTFTTADTLEVEPADHKAPLLAKYVKKSNVAELFLFFAYTNACIMLGRWLTYQTPT